MKHLRGNHGFSVLMMLSLIVTLNGSQAMVLCVGSDGHVAIEPAGHDHCADGTHICESDADVHHTDLAPDTDGARCHGCTDLALAGEICNDPTASGMSKIIFVGLATVSTPPQTSPDDTAYMAILASTSLTLYHVPLSSVVLQV